MFKGASRFLKSVFKGDIVWSIWQKGVVTGDSTLSRHHGGVGHFLRMVQSTKRCLRKMVGQARLTQDELLTTVTEIESIINSCPLTYISSGDLEEPPPRHIC